MTSTAPARRDLPILFIAPMVRAILNGQKTQIRRVVDPQPATLCRYEMNGAGKHALHLGPPRHPGEVMAFVPPTPTSTDHSLQCPYGEPGGWLWVKEAFQIVHVSIDPETGYGDDVEAAPKIPKDNGGGWWSPIWRATDAAADQPPEDRGFDWRPAIHMPRWASRLMLEVVEVRVQRLHEVSEDDARAEGMRIPDAATARQDTVDTYGMTPYRAAFACLWEHTNGKRAPWSSNPWIWAISFRMLP